MPTPGRIQPANKGGCWFLSILNGFLLGYRGRELLKRRLNEYANTNLANFRRALGAVGNVCPMPGRLNSGLFWAYVNERLKTRSRNINRAVNQNALIKNLAIKNKNNYDVGSEFELGKFLKKMWPTFKTPESPILALRYVPMYGQAVPAVVRLEEGNPEFNSILKKYGKGVYRLSHAYIAGLWNIPGGGRRGHAVCGYIRPDGDQMIYDSNDLRSFKYNWRTKWKVLQNHMYNHYAHEDGADPESIEITYVAIFVKTSTSGANNNNNVRASWPPNTTLPVENRWKRSLLRVKRKFPFHIGKVN
jgi:hypothetical protein